MKNPQIYINDILFLSLINLKGKIAFSQNRFIVFRIFLYFTSFLENPFLLWCPLRFQHGIFVYFSLFFPWFFLLYFFRNEWWFQDENFSLFFLLMILDSWKCGGGNEEWFGCFHLMAVMIWRVKVHGEIWEKFFKLFPKIGSIFDSQIFVFQLNSYAHRTIFQVSKMLAKLIMNVKLSKFGGNPPGNFPSYWFHRISTWFRLKFQNQKKNKEWKYYREILNEWQGKW